VSITSSSPARKKAGCREDDDLMRLIAAGDQKAAGKVVEDHLPLLISLARHMLGNEAEADEIAQDAFLKLWKQADKWEPGRALVSTWLRRVASNLCIDRLRQRRTRAMTAQDDQPVGATQQLELEEKELKQRVNMALDGLPERQKLALVLCHYQGMSQRQASRVLEISEHALESLLARARRRLKASLENEWRQLLPDRAQVERHNEADIPKRVKR
jgi:RNA polymerase sigma-70 factor (ECF subfamily)